MGRKQGVAAPSPLESSAGGLRTGLPPPQAWMKKSLGFPLKLGQPVPLKMFTIFSMDTGPPSTP